MKQAILIIIIALASVTANAQNLIGFKGKEIRSFMKENRKDLNYNKVKNDSFRYLKYSDGPGNQTMLFFLDMDSVCQSIRIILDEELKSQKKSEFDSKYEKKGEYAWSETRKGRKYAIRMVDEKWATVINIVPEK